MFESSAEGLGGDPHVTPRVFESSAEGLGGITLNPFWHQVAMIWVAFGLFLEPLGTILVLLDTISATLVPQVGTRADFR